MAVRSGNGSGTINLPKFEVHNRIVSLSITNRAGSSITFTIYIKDSLNPSSSVAISSVAGTLSTGQAYVRESPIELKANNYISIVSSGSIDYHFTYDLAFNTSFGPKY
jgi:hypothetical protein